MLISILNVRNEFLLVKIVVGWLVGFMLEMGFYLLKVRVFKKRRLNRN